MSSRPRVMLSGIFALIIATTLIVASTLTGVPLPFTSRVINPGAPPGTLSVLLTDPPYIPEGVTGVYITYNNLAVHVAGFPSDTGWTKISSHGTIDTLGLVNVSLTISSSKISTGQYNALRFNISSALTTFQGRNYSTFVRNSALTIPIIGGIEVNASRPVATLIDIQPTVLNIGTQSLPQFVLSAAANATPVPNAQAATQIHQVGFKMPLQSQAWFAHFTTQYGLRFELTSVALTQNSLRVSAKSQSGSDLKLRFVAIFPAVTQHRATGLPQMLFGSAIFQINADGTLKPLQLGDTQSAVEQGVRALFAGPGFDLARGASTSFSYTGTIISSFAAPSGHGFNVVAGGTYAVAIIGDQTLAGALVTAG